MSIAGYLALGLLGLLLAIPYMPSSLAPFKEPFGLAVMALAVVFGVRGIRYGRGLNRLAAWLALVVLTITMLGSVAIHTYRSVVEMSRSVTPGR